jgi:hypothetical protein
MECSADWIANSPIDAFLDAVAARHGSDRSGLDRLSTPAQKRQDEHSDLRSDLAGSWICYSNAWSPYFRGQIVRGSLSFAETEAETERSVTYMEALPTGELRLDGTLSLGRRALHMSLRERSGDTRFMFCLFPPNSPATVLGGLMCGATVLGPGPAPSVSRVIAVRLPAGRKPTATRMAYLAKGGSLADDLASLGLPVSRPTVVDEELVRFLTGGDGCGLDQPSPAGFRAIVELFDREWLTRIGEMTNATVSNGPPLSDG